MRERVLDNSVSPNFLINDGIVDFAMTGSTDFDVDVANTGRMTLAGDEQSLLNVTGSVHVADGQLRLGQEATLLVRNISTVTGADVVGSGTLKSSVNVAGGTLKPGTLDENANTTVEC